MLLTGNVHADERGEIALFLKKGSEYQSKAFQSLPEERTRFFRKAAEEYEKIIYLAPEEFRGYISAGACYEHLSEFPKAIAVYAQGIERLKSTSQKLTLLSGIARIHVNSRNFRGVTEAIDRMETLKPNALETAWACQGIVVFGADKKMREFYFQKGLKICNYTLKNSGKAEMRQAASNIKEGMLTSYGKKAPARDSYALSSRTKSDSWLSIVTAVERGEYEKAVHEHQKLVNKSSGADPLSRNFIDPVPGYLSHAESLFEAYAMTGRWKEFFELVARLMNRRNELKDDLFEGKPLSAMLPKLDRFLREYIARQSRLFSKKPLTELFIPGLWLHEIKDDELFTASMNDASGPLSDPEILAVGHWSGGAAYRIVMKFSLPPVSEQVEIERAEVSLFTQHKYAQASLSADGVPLLYALPPALDQEFPSGRREAPSRDPAQNHGIPPDADRLLRRDIGNFQGGYAAGQVYVFDITTLVKAWHKKGRAEGGVMIMFDDEKSPALRAFWSNAGLHPPKVSIIMKSSVKPALDDVIEFHEDWISYYTRGLARLYKGRTGETDMLWEKAKEASGDEAIGRYIEQHRAIVGESSREEPIPDPDSRGVCPGRFLGRSRPGPGYK